MNTMKFQMERKPVNNSAMQFWGLFLITGGPSVVSYMGAGMVYVCRQHESP